MRNADPFRDHHAELTMPHCRTALFVLALGTASALPVVELQKDVYGVALKEVGTPWLIEIY